MFALDTLILVARLFHLPAVVVLLHTRFFHLLAVVVFAGVVLPPALPKRPMSLYARRGRISGLPR